MKKKTVNLILEIVRAALAIIAGALGGANSDSLCDIANSIGNMIV